MREKKGGVKSKKWEVKEQRMEGGAEREGW